MCFRKTRKPEVTEAKLALNEAMTHLHEVEEREPEIHRITEESRKLRRENHFAADLQAIFHQGGAR